MSIEPKGEIKGAFPATTKGTYNEIQKILVRPKATATGVVAVQCNGVTVANFNTPAATGPLDEPLHIGEGDGNALDPTQFSIVPDAGGNGAFVTYIVE